MLLAETCTSKSLALCVCVCVYQNIDIYMERDRYSDFFPVLYFYFLVQILFPVIPF